MKACKSKFPKTTPRLTAVRNAMYGLEITQGEVAERCRASQNHVS